MKYQDIHPWAVSCSEALLIQKKLSRMVESKPLDQPINFVAGADISFSKADNRLFTAVVVLTFLRHEGETIGMVLRTRRKTKPIFVSIGHMIDLDMAVSIVLACTRTYRLPETNRRAHILANRIRVEALAKLPASDE